MAPTNEDEVFQINTPTLSGKVPKLHAAIDRAKRHNLDKYINAEPSTINHRKLFPILQRHALYSRLEQDVDSLGWFSPLELYVFDEYCSRFAVKQYCRYINYVFDLLDHAEVGRMIDPTLIHYCFAFASSHLNGTSPDGSQTIFYEETQQFNLAVKRIQKHLEDRLSTLRYSFPFGRPEGSLKAALALLERVAIFYHQEKDEQFIQKAMRKNIEACLGKAAELSFSRIATKAQLEIVMTHSEDPLQMMEMSIFLCELATEVSRETSENHVEGKEVFSWWMEALNNHIVYFWSLVKPHIEQVLIRQPPDTWDCFPLFHQLNDYFLNSLTIDNILLCNGDFHAWLCDTFAPMVIRYSAFDESADQKCQLFSKLTDFRSNIIFFDKNGSILHFHINYENFFLILSALYLDIMETNIHMGLKRGLKLENWSFVAAGGSNVAVDILWKVEALWHLISEMNWPDPVFCQHLNERLIALAAQCVSILVKFTLSRLQILKQEKVSGDFRLGENYCSMISTILHCRHFWQRIIVISKEQQLAIKHNHGIMLKVKKRQELKSIMRRKQRHDEVRLHKIEKQLTDKEGRESSTSSIFNGHNYDRSRTTSKNETNSIDGDNNGENGLLSSGGLHGYSSIKSEGSLKRQNSQGLMNRTASVRDGNSKQELQTVDISINHHENYRKL